jgi:PPOX class probable FMN-dependent enzyme
MASPDDYRIGSIGQLRSLMGEPNGLTYQKVLPELDSLAIDFIKRSPFLVLATADADGNQDASPKGDHPGFVLIENPSSVVIPERKGNKLLFGLQNILLNPQVGILFVLPGSGETLRVNGTAELTTDPDLLGKLTARGAPALLATRVKIRECFFHCAKAFIRSQLWRPESWPDRVAIKWGTYLGAKIGADEKLANQINDAIELDYNSVDPARSMGKKNGADIT